MVKDKPNTVIKAQGHQIVKSLKPASKTKSHGLKLAKDLMRQFDILDDAKYITKEFQDYGYRLAVQLNDLKHKSLYIKLAKEEKRHILEEALRFTADYPAVRSKAKIFMWKVLRMLILLDMWI